MRSAAVLSLMLASAAWAAEPPAGEPAKKRERPALAQGSAPPDELGRDVQGDKIRISDHRGKVVIVSFWASWCKPCLKELPVLAGVAKRVGPDHLKIFAINFQDGAESFRYVVKTLKEYSITMLRDANGKAAKLYDVRAIPRMIIIGRDGTVSSDHTGYGEDSLPELVDELNRLLAQQT